MPKLNDTQLIILSTAAKRDSGAVRPLSKSIKADPPTIDRALKSLLKRELLREQALSEGRRNGKGDASQALVITDAGREAIDTGKEPLDEAGAPSKARHTPKAIATAVAQPDAGPSGIRPTSKLGQAVALLSRGEGTTIAELMKATGWQAHSVRGAISGSLKKKHGLNVTSVSEEGKGRVYRIVQAG